MKKAKLLALVYSQEDIDKIKNWIAVNSENFELSAFSDTLHVPIQAALSHFCKAENIVDSLMKTRLLKNSLLTDSFLTDNLLTDSLLTDNLLTDSLLEGSLLEGNSIDGFVIDDHRHYNSIVMNQLSWILDHYSLALFSASAGKEAVAGSLNKCCNELLASNSFEAARSLKDTFQPVAVLSRPEKKLAV